MFFSKSTIADWMLAFLFIAIFLQFVFPLIMVEFPVYRTSSQPPWTRTLLKIEELVQSANALEWSAGQWNRHLESGSLVPTADVIPLDGWGRPIRAKSSSSGEVDFYSLGSDGRSSSAGNDVDDINSWQADSANSYRYASLCKSLFRRILIVLFVLLLIGTSYWRKGTDKARGQKT